MHINQRHKHKNEAMQSKRKAEALQLEPGEHPVPPLEWNTPRSSAGPSYLGLLIVIIVGVAVGNLLSNWITATIAERRMDMAAREAVKVMRSVTAQTSQAQIDAAQRAEAARSENQERLVQVRSTDAIGIKLNRQCEDWKQMAAQMKSPTADVEAARACTRYRQYLDTGRQ